MHYLYLTTALLLAVSFAFNARKSLRALKVSGKRFLMIAPSFLFMLALVATALELIPESLLEKVLRNEDPWRGIVAALGIGSVSVMPGFIAYPMCSVFRGLGAANAVIAAFATSLMMVGVFTFPMESRYLGWRLAAYRNACSLAIAAAVAIAMGLAFGEL